MRPYLLFTTVMIAFAITGPAVAGSEGGRVRVSLNGFRVNHETNDDPLERDGVRDEVFLVPEVFTIDGSRTLASYSHRAFTSVMGQRRWPQVVQAGTGSSTGGLQTGDGFPTGAPWSRAGYSGTAIPPTVLFDGELWRHKVGVILAPTIWEWDATPMDLLFTYYRNIETALRLFAPAAGDAVARARGDVGLDLRAPGLDGVPAGDVQQGIFARGKARPIGMFRPRGANSYTFATQFLLLTWDGAVMASGTDFGFGSGVIPIRYVDDAELAGDYTLFLQVEVL
jgi:hypothetical protein